MSAALLEGRTVILVTHDPLEALRLGHRIHVLAGRPAHLGPALTLPGAPPRDRLAALLHDAPEYVIGDMISPFKAVVGGDYKPVEERLLAAIHLRFGLPVNLPKTLTASIKKADRIAAYWEAVHLAGFDEGEAAKYFRRPHQPLTGNLKTLLASWPAKQAEIAYMKRFQVLTKAFSG